MVRKIFIPLSLAGVIASGAFMQLNPSATKSDCGQFDFKAYERFRTELKPVSGQTKLSPAAVCFAPGTDPAIVAAFQQAMQDSHGWPSPNRYQLTDRWPGSQGDPFTVRWSFVPDGLQVPGLSGQDAASDLFAKMDAKFNGNRAAWIAKFEEAFARWSSLTGLKYVRVKDGTNDWDDNAAWSEVGSDTHGDVRISGRSLDGASGVLAFNNFPASNGQGGNMVIDTDESWGDATGNYRFLFNVVSHEHGHGIGLLHVCPIAGTKLMEPFYSDDYYGPQQDDIRGGNRLYGDSHEPDNDIATAFNAGAINAATNMTLGNIANAPNASSLSIDANGEEDYFKVSVTSATKLTATVTPVGTTYTQGPQTGQCASGTSTNALNQADLAIEIRSSAGTVLASATANPSSQAETVSFDLLSAGNYYVRVYETGSQTQSQLYRLQMVGASASGIITGNVNFLEWTSPNASLPITMTVRNAATEALVATVNSSTNSLGQYYVTIPGLAANTSYRITMDGMMWLSRSQTVTTPPSITISGLNFTLPNGDSDGSGEVDLNDIDLVISAYGTGQADPGFTFARDLDGSGEVDLNDIDIVIGAYGLGDE